MSLSVRGSAFKLRDAIYTKNCEEMQNILEQEPIACFTILMETIGYDGVRCMIPLIVEYADPRQGLLSQKIRYDGVDVRCNDMAYDAFAFATKVVLIFEEYELTKRREACLMLLSQGAPYYQALALQKNFFWHQGLSRLAIGDLQRAIKKSGEAPAKVEYNQGRELTVIHYENLSKSDQDVPVLLFFLGRVLGDNVRPYERRQEKLAHLEFICEKLEALEEGSLDQNSVSIINKILVDIEKTFGTTSSFLDRNEEEKIKVRFIQIREKIQNLISPSS